MKQLRIYEKKVKKAMGVNLDDERRNIYKKRTTEKKKGKAR